MATISPSSLDEILEGNAVNVTFQAILGANEVLVNIEIISHRENDGITVDGANFQGQYIDSFDLGANAIKYRSRIDNSDHTVQHFSDIPDYGTAHVYEFNAPSTLTTEYQYTVKLDYQVVVTDPVTMQTTTTDHTMQQTIPQTVRGTWDKWAQELRTAISQSGE